MFILLKHTRTRTHARTHARTDTPTHTPTHTHPHKHTLTHTHARAHTRTHANTHMFTLSIQVRNVRNKLFHSDNLKVTDSALSDRIKVMVTLLEDKTTLFDDSAAQGAVHELNGVSTFQRRNPLMSMEGVRNSRQHWIYLHQCQECFGSILVYNIPI